MPKNDSHVSKKNKSRIIRVDKVTAEAVGFLSTKTISRREFRMGMKSPGVAFGKKLITPSCFRRTKEKKSGHKKRKGVMGRRIRGPIFRNGSDSPRH